MSLMAIISICLLWYSCFMFNCDSLPVVMTNNGPIEGTVETISNREIYVFKGIPYAEPPTGELRFQRPQAKNNWNETYDAKAYKNACMQPYTGVVDNPQSEDCLYLNVWTPSTANSSRLPVMLWIHGGAFQVGAGAQLSPIKRQNVYDGLRLADREVVVVTVNYRLGVFGFLYGNRTDAPANAGLWDQAMALNWTRANIANFGGNADEITLFGESAGSISISYLIVSNSSFGITNWFQRAIMQSSSAFGKIGAVNASSGYKLARDFATNSYYWKQNQCPNDNTWIDCLRAKSAEDLLDAQTRTGRIVDHHFVGFAPFIPLTGDELLPLGVDSAIKEGNFKTNITILLGHNEMEGIFTTVLFDIENGLSGRYTPSVSKPQVIDKSIVTTDIAVIFFKSRWFASYVAKAYTDPLGVADDQQLMRRSAVFSYSDAYNNCPVVLFGAYITNQSCFTGKIFQYRLTYANSNSISNGSDWANVTHTDDLSLVFGRPFANPDEWSDEDRSLSANILDIWSYFAKNKGDLPIVNEKYGVWPSYTITSAGHVNASYLELHADSSRLGRIFGNRYRGHDGYKPSVINNCFELWDSIFKKQFTDEIYNYL